MRRLIDCSSKIKGFEIRGLCRSKSMGDDACSKLVVLCIDDLFLICLAGCIEALKGILCDRSGQYLFILIQNDPVNFSEQSIVLFGAVYLDHLLFTMFRHQKSRVS